MKYSITIALLIGLTAPARALEQAEAAAEHAVDAKLTAAFADHLMDEGDYYRAIGEYERAIFLWPQAPQAAAWALSIGQAYREGEQFETAAKAYDKVVQRYGPQAKGEALLGAAKSYMGAGQFETAVARARDAAQVFGEGSEKAREAHYAEGWALLQSNRDQEAAKAFELARGEGAVGQGATKLVQLLPQLEHLPSKSPGLAGALGLVPGLGHLYIGDPATALSALVWNGIFAWALYDAVNAHNWSLAVVLGLFESMWYGGSIVGAVSGAHRYNHDARINALEDLAKIAPPTVTDEYGQKTQ